MLESLMSILDWLEAGKLFFEKITGKFDIPWGIAICDQMVASGSEPKVEEKDPTWKFNFKWTPIPLFAKFQEVSCLFVLLSTKKRGLSSY